MAEYEKNIQTVTEWLGVSRQAFEKSFFDVKIRALADKIESLSVNVDVVASLTNLSASLPTAAAPALPPFPGDAQPDIPQNGPRKTIHDYSVTDFVALSEDERKRLFDEAQADLTAKMNRLTAKENGEAPASALTIREEFAARALTGILADPSMSGYDHPVFAKAAVSHADALLAELAK